MKTLLRRWFSSNNNPAEAPYASVPAPVAEVDGKSFDVAANAKSHEGLPHPDWREIHAWVGEFDESRHEAALIACERAWLGMLAQALGPEYRVFESKNVLVLSSRPENEAEAALAFVDGARRRVRRLLEELAGDDTGKEILLAFADRESYSRYASCYCPSLDESMVSAGMFLHAAREHFIVCGEQMWKIEPTIVHELTHAQLSHLKLPLWVNEGMAVNTEQRLTRRGASAFEVKALEKKHVAFWTPDTIQEFWNGKAYKRDGEGSKLAYDLGRLLVNGMCRDWSAFKRFAAAATSADGGAQAAADVLHIDLGQAVRHFLGAADGDWGPQPQAWAGAVEVETE